MIPSDNLILHPLMQSTTFYGYRVELENNFCIGFTITEKAPTRAFSCLKVPTSAFTFKNLIGALNKGSLGDLVSSSEQ